MRTTCMKMLAAGSMLLLLTGCINGRLIEPPGNSPLKQPGRAILVTEDVEIEVLDAEDGMPSRIVPGEPFAPGRYFPRSPLVAYLDEGDGYGHRSFQPDDDQGYYGMHRFIDVRTTDKVTMYFIEVVPGSPADRAGWPRSGVYLKAFEATGSTRLTPVVPEGRDPEDVVRAGDRFDYVVCGTREAARAGGDACLKGELTAVPVPPPYRVRVHIAGRDEPLYGLVAFFPVAETAPGSASRIHRLVIPDEYVERARGGNVSVVYQPYDHVIRKPNSISGEIKEHDHQRASWALWLSDVPFD